MLYLWLVTDNQVGLVIQWFNELLMNECSNIKENVMAEDLVAGG